ncbi:MAG: hypothetical protein R6X14_00850 [bacterium]
MRTLMSAIGVCVLLCAVAGASDMGTAGIYTDVQYNGNPENQSYITCWRKQAHWASWEEYYDYQYTGDQSWPPDHNRLRWGASSLSDPKIVIETGYYYTFKAKKYIGGQWRYSNWSTPVNYSSATVYASRVLELSLTSDPGDPTMEVGGD